MSHIKASSTLSVTYKITHCSDQATSYQSVNIDNKNPTNYWRTSKPIQEAWVELSFVPSLLHSIEIRNQGSPQIQILAYNKDEHQQPIGTFTCVPKSTLISLPNMKDPDQQDKLQVYDLSRLLNFPRDRHFTFLKISIFNPFHNEEPRTMGLQWVIVTKLDDVQQRKIFESKREKIATDKLLQLQGSYTNPRQNISSPLIDRKPLFKDRNPPIYLTSERKSNDYLNFDKLSVPKSPLFNHTRNSLNNSYISIKDNTNLLSGIGARSPMKNISSSSTPTKNQFGLSGQKNFKKTPVRDKRAEEEDEEFMKAMEESKKLYDQEQRMKEVGGSDLFYSTEIRDSSNVGPIRSVEDRENVNARYHQMLYATERMDEEMEKSAAIPFDDIEYSHDMPDNNNSNSAISFVSNGATDEKNKDFYKANLEEETPVENNYRSANKPSTAAARTAFGGFHNNIDREMWQLRQSDYSSEYLEMEKRERAKIVKSEVIGGNNHPLVPLLVFRIVYNFF